MPRNENLDAVREIEQILGPNDLEQIYIDQAGDIPHDHVWITHEEGLPVDYKADLTTPAIVRKRGVYVDPTFTKETITAHGLIIIDK